MRRRQGFTLVELLVAMALIIFIMAILSQAFVAATTAFRELKAAGDLAEKLRATTQLLQRDLSADHFEGKKRLSNPNFWANGPPQQGFFQIWHGSASSSEGTDLATVNSYRTVNHALAFTIKVRGNQMGDFPSVSAPTPLVTASNSFGPVEARYQTTPLTYNYQWAEVAWFLQPSNNPATGLQDTTASDSSSTPTPLYTLYRRQRLAVPDNDLVTQANLPSGIPNTQITNCLELSCWQNNYITPPPTPPSLYFNSPTDLTIPWRRFGGSMGGPPPTPPTYPNASTYPTLQSQGAIANLTGADIQLTDVVSFDVRILVAGAPTGVDPFVTLFDSPFTTAYTYTSPTAGATWMVFDTWSSVTDVLSDFSQWNVAGQATTIPFWNTTTQAGPIIQALQISIRIWDGKTNQTRQVTIIQAM